MQNIPTDLLFSLIPVFFCLYNSWGFSFLLGIEMKIYKARQLNEHSSFSNNLVSLIPDLTVIRTHFFLAKHAEMLCKRVILLQSCPELRVCHYISFLLVSNMPTEFLKVHWSSDKGDISHRNWTKIWKKNQIVKF